MNLSDLGGRERIDVSAAEVIVVRADDYIFISLPRKISKHVIHCGPGGLDVHRERCVLTRRQFERRRPGRRVDLILQSSERLPCRLQPFIGHGILDLRKDDADIFRPAHAAEASQQILFAIAQFSIQHDQRLGSMVAGVDRLGDDLRVARHSLLAGLFGEGWRLEAESENDLIFDVDARVVVVVKFVGGDSVTHEDEWGMHRAGRRKTERYKVLLGFQFMLLPAICHNEFVFSFELRSGDDAERLKITVGTRGLETETFISFFDQVLGANNTLRAGAAAFHLRRGQGLDVVKIAMRVGDLDVGGRVGSRQPDRENDRKNGKASDEFDSTHGNAGAFILN